MRARTTSDSTGMAALFFPACHLQGKRRKLFRSESVLATVGGPTSSRLRRNLSTAVHRRYRTARLRVGGIGVAGHAFSPTHFPKIEVRYINERGVSWKASLPSQRRRQAQTEC
eukprot:6105462-Pleurochrysis_carterae.AAC.1